MLAVKLLKAIEEKMAADGGALYRTLLRDEMAKLEDAYKGLDDPFRSHLGASQIGRACERELWYKFNWAHLSQGRPQMLRLWNRGHLEEGRFIALIKMVGVEFVSLDANGQQLKISDHMGHYGGSKDGHGINWPDLAPGVPALGEFKTHNDKSFEHLKSMMLREAKWEHYVQMQEYMWYDRLQWGVYMAVNKNNDEIYAELIESDPMVAKRYAERAGNIIAATFAPPKINSNPGWYQCQFCDERPVCHLNAPVEVNCRTCRFSQPWQDKTWFCHQDQTYIDPRLARQGCRKHEFKPDLVR